jgi:thiamine biosynthesis lipoprotein
VTARAPIPRIAMPAAIDAANVGSIDRRWPIVDLSGETMGTGWSVRFACPPEIEPAAVRAAVEARLAGLVAELSHWAADSLLSRFNAAAAGSWCALAGDFAAVMHAGLRIAQMSDGAFDPAMGRLVDLWGYGPPGPMPAPDAAAVATALAASGWRRLTLADGRMLQPGGLALDLSGIAKGHAVDAVAALLRALGIRHALVEIGGELVGMGMKPDGDPWWVDLEVPPGLDLPPLRIALHQLAVATSGDYQRGAHTLDPRTGVPVANNVVSVSVIHSSAMEADAWATALTVLGPGEGLWLATAHGLAARIVVLCPDGGAAEHVTPALAAMMA